MQLKGKPIALANIILADLWVIGSALYYLVARGTITSDESSAIITIGAFIAFSPTPINLSLIIQTIKGLPSASIPQSDPSTSPEATKEDNHD